MYMNVKVSHIKELIDGNLPHRIWDNTDYSNPTMLAVSWEDNYDDTLEKYNEWSVVDIAKPTDANIFCVDIFIENE